MAPRRLGERALLLAASVLRGLIDRHAFEAAAAVAFWFFLSLVPLLVLGGFLIGLVARARGVDALLAPLLDVVPETAETLVRTEIGRLAGSRGSGLAPLGIASYLWTSSSGLKNLMDVFETASQAKRRPWWKKRAIALAWVVLGLATMCLVALLIVRIDAAPHDGLHRSLPRAPGSPRRHTHIPAPGEQLVAASLTLIAGMGFLAGFYRFAVEHARVRRRRVWPGTFAAVLSWLVVSWAFGAYVGSIGGYALFYGSLAAVAVLLIWLYLTSFSIVLGAEVNTQLEADDARAHARAGRALASLERAD
ncbi:MAG TPA: YihY/virulence factor BrkB family protein [Polyangiaceae bacterium]